MRTFGKPLAALIALLLAWTADRAAAQTSVTIPDPRLEQAVRAALSKPAGGLTSLDLQELGVLACENVGITNLTGLEWATNLTALFAGGNLVTNLAPLQGLGRLNALSLYNNSVGDLTPLSGMTNLNYLELRWNPLTNAAVVLPGLIGLTNLYLGGGSLASVAFLTNLPRLSLLVLDHNQITDPSPLGALPGLRGLDLGYNPLISASTLGAFTNLAALASSGNAITNLGFVSNLTGLTSLTASANSIVDSTPLSSLWGLKELNLSGNPINGYGGLAGLTNLGGLWLQGNVVGSPDFVSGLRRLSFLDCDQCQITNLSPLIALTNLQGLCLSSNAISAGVGLGNLSRLGYLDLSYNSLLNYTAIGALTNLTSLYLGGNGLTNLSFLSGMPQLRALGLEHNALSDLGTMAGLTNLGYLNVNYNRLTNITSLQGIKPGVTALVQYDLLDLNTGSAALSVIAAVQEAGGSITYLPQNQPPGIQIVTNWIVASGATTSLGFSVFDDATPSGQLLVTANFANTALFPPGSVVLAGSNGDRVLLVTPVAGQTGTNVITLTATDESGSATNVFVTVSVIAPVTVTVTDPNLDAALRQAIGKTTGELDNLDFLSLTTLIAPDAALTNLAGLQWAVNLTGLSLDVTGVTNLAPLQSLSHLSGLSLKNVFNAPDLSPLSALTNLTSLSLNGKAITNLAFLQPLTQLTYLTLNNSRATTMDPLAGLTNLVVLGLQVNLLTNVWAITNLTQLTSADLTLNLLDLTDGSPARTAIQIAQALGATVHYDPQRQAPVITIQPSYVVNDNASSLLFFTVRDNRPAGDLLWVAAGSGNEALLPNDTNHLVAAQLPTGDGGLDWAVVVNPLPYRTGNAQVTLAATNESGLSTSITFLITVVSSQSVDGSYFVGSNLQWSGGGSAPWFGQNIITHAGAPAAQSGSIGNGGESILEATALGPGTLTYWWKVSSEAGWDFLEFYLNEVLQPNRISGEVDWQQKVFSLPVGTNVVRWRYFKDPGCCSQGLDAAWLAQVNFTFKSWLELMQRTPNGQVQLLLHVQPGKLYELQTSTNLANWSSLKLVQTNSFTMAFTDTTATPASRFYRLMEFPILLDSPARLAGGAVQLRLHSPAGHRFELQATTNFTAWSTLGMVTNTLGTVSFTDTTATNLTRRFYRAALR